MADPVISPRAAPLVIMSGPGAGGGGGGMNSAVPQTITGTSGTITSQSVVIAATGTCTLTLPTQHKGDWLFLKTTTPQIIKSASANVVPQLGGAAGTAIFSADAPHWCGMQFDGTNWIVFASA